MIESSDFGVFLDRDNSHLVNRAILAANRYDSLDTSLKAYVSRRVDLQDILAHYSKIEPGTGRRVTLIPPDKMGFVEVRTDELEGLILQIEHYSKEQIEEVRSLCREIAAAITKKFGTPIDITFEKGAGKGSPKEGV